MIYRILLIYCLTIFAFTQCGKKDSHADISTNDDISELDTSALSLAAEVYRKKNDFAEAVENYSRLIDIDSTNKVYYYRRALSYSSLGNVDLAIKDCEKAKDLGFDEFKSRFLLGMLYYDLHANKDSIARANLNRCLQLRPNSPKVLDRIKYMDKMDAALSPEKKKT